MSEGGPEPRPRRRRRPRSVDQPLDEGAGTTALGQDVAPEARVAAVEPVQAIELSEGDAPIDESPAGAEIEASAPAPGRRRGHRGGRRANRAQPPVEDLTDLAAAPAVGADESLSSLAGFSTEDAAAEDAGGSSPQQDDQAVTATETTVVAPAAAKTQKARAEPSPVVINVAVPRGLGRKLSSKLIQQAAQTAIARDGWSQAATLDILLVTDAEMREINVTRRGIDEATDVLSFPMIEARPGGDVALDFFVLPPDSTIHLGDVVISHERVEAQATEGGHSKERELAFLTVHGVLHILGYDHDVDVRRRHMRSREEEVLAALGLRRNGA